MTAPTDAVRIAVEGCGHGTLDAIYASVKKSCEIKGWDGVDLLIICGDFQAVRNHQDLNVTAMPAKYRKIGDFHQYYYGTKKAPYLTVFIGGNHEASNHLFELHYGGWAAPDIYYLGAANVITLGPITIAGTSGVYKKYDYRRPHFERLPYNGSEIRSIYHQRELDIRKLLSYRSQVDIGLSHDWPRGIEWLGDHKALFARKKYLRAEAETGELGSLPSALVLDRLRPPYWFSAHHHYRYTAIKQHKNQKDIQQVTPVDAVNTKVATNSESSLSKNERSKKSCDPPTEGVLQPQEPTFTKVATISAWNAFKNRVAQQDAEDERRDEQALRQKIEEQERSGQPAYASYNFEENFKEVNISEANGAQRRSSQSPNKQVSKAMPQLDGTCCSLPLAKRRRKSSPSDVTQQSTRVRVDQVDGSGSEATVTNPDAIDIDMSDSDSEIDQLSLETQPDDGSERRVNVLHKTRKDDYDMDINGDIIDSTDGSQPRQRVTSRTLPRMPLIQEAASRESLLATDSKSDTLTVDPDSTIYLPANGSVSNSTPTSAGDILGHRRDSGHAMSDDHMTQRVTVGTNTAARLPEYSTVDTSMESAEGGVTLHTESGSEDESEAGDNVDYVDFDKKKSEQQSTADDKNDGTDIPDDVRAQLAEMSSTFAPEEKIVKSGHLPFPEDIGNKETRFLALGKVEEGEPNEFLQLLEIKRYDPTDVKEPPAVGPRNFAYELQYDPEWLAITRVFASELKLGGSQRDGVPPHRGETYYRERILEEEQWVDENITKKNLLKIPNNFVIQTEQQDWDALPYKEKSAMPRELTNPQTSQFCELLGIPNPFDISEGERDARMERGPASDDWQQRTANRGRGGNGGNRGGRGGWGGRGRGGGSGRGRGRGRGFN